MTNESEIEASTVTEALSANASEAGTIMEVKFQKNPRQKYKFLEGEPKILGVTEIAIAVFFISWRLTFNIGATDFFSNNLAIVLSSVGIIAGSVAIAAQNLHLPTIKACLGIQIVTCVAYTFCVILTLNDFNINPGNCWNFFHDNETVNENSTCIDLERAYTQMSTADELLETVQIMISVTLAIYCCKVIACCTPGSHMPVITVAAPTAQE